MRRTRSIRFPISWKLNLLLISSTILFALIVYGLVVPMVGREKRMEREAKLSAVTDAAVSLMWHYENAIRTYQWKSDASAPRTRREAQDRVLEYLRVLRYEQDEYLFILDGNGVMIMHPLKSELEGKDMSSETAPDGRMPFNEMTRGSQKQDRVFIRYIWQSKWSRSVHEPQTTCAQFFYPWNWVVCSSVYTQDIEDAMQDIIFRTALYLGIGLCAGWVGLSIMGRLISRPITHLSKQVRSMTREIDSGQLSPIPVSGNDEVAELAGAFSRMVEKLKQVMTGLRESEERLQSIIDNTTAVIYMKDVTGRYLMVNRQYGFIFNLSRKEIIDKTDHDLFPKETADVFRKNDLEVISCKKAIQFEETVFHKDRLHTYISVKFPLYDINGKIYAVCGISTDITDRKENEQQMKSLLKKLEHKTEELQNIVYISSHDLRSPLVNIQGFSGELSLHCKELSNLLGSWSGPENEYQTLKQILDEDIPVSVEYIVSSANKMNTLISGLLRLSRVASQEIVIEEVDMNHVMTDIINNNTYQIQHQKAFVTFDPLPPCMADEAQVNQVFSNLMDNALKYADTSRNLEIHISGKVQDLHAVYRFKDNGIGIDPQYYEKIFQVFHRLNPETSEKGEGLGLTIVKRILDQLNGSIELESEVGTGTVFIITLPAI